MANQHAIARTAAGLEALARAVREGRRAWDPQTLQLGLRGVDDLKIFVRRAGTWTEADTAKAEALAQQLEQVAGRPSAQIRAAEAIGLGAGARAFVAGEGAAIAGALERAAQALRAKPLAHDPLQHVMRALQPLRGLAALADLPPLPDLLEGIERAIAELSRSGLQPPANVGELFQIAGSAIARAAREVAERGRPDPEGADFRQFAGLLVKVMESEPDAVSIGSLYYNDSGPHIVSRGVPAARPSTLGKLELVSHGEHLRQAADSLERAPSATQRELRAHTLGTTFRALANAGGGVLADRVAQFAVAAREAVASGIAVSSAAAFAAELRRAGDLLARSGTGDEEALASELDSLTAALRTIQPGAPAPAAARAAAPAPSQREQQHERRRGRGLPAGWSGARQSGSRARTRALPRHRCLSGPGDRRRAAARRRTRPHCSRQFPTPPLRVRRPRTEPRGRRARHRRRSRARGRWCRACGRAARAAWRRARARASPPPGAGARRGSPAPACRAWTGAPSERRATRCAGRNRCSRAIRSRRRRARFP